MVMDNSYETRILEEKTEKLGFRMVIISALIPVIVLGIGFFAYTDIKNDLEVLNKSKANDIENISTDIEDKIFKISSKAEGIESRLSDYAGNLKNAENIIANIKKEYNDKFRNVRSDVEKNIEKDIKKILDNQKRIKTLANKINQSSKKLIAIDKNLSATNRNYKVILVDIKAINAEIKLINDNQDQLLTSSKALAEKLEKADRDILKIKKNAEDKLKDLNIEKINKNIDLLFREIKKREIETRLLKDNISLLKKEIESNKTSVPKASELIEQDIQ